MAKMQIFGHRVDPPHQPGVGSVSSLLRADEKTIKDCARLWPQADLDDFEQLEGRRPRWRDRATGKLYRRVPGCPLLSHDPASTGTELFAVTAAGKLLFLRPDAAAQPVTIRPIGSLWSAKYEPGEAPIRKSDSSPWVY